ncbi:MAG: ABC transporter ATP-binding protein [Betaproteobacteria bacterium]|nr:MAG: ABC transporter ATP-binding protein [Betaproteobacteria bacterium]
MNTTSKVYQLLTFGRRRSVFLLLALMLVGMVFETVGIGLLIPVLGLLTSAEIDQAYPFLAPVYGLLKDTPREQVVVWTMLALVLIFVLKDLFLAFLAWRQSRFAFDTQARLSQRLFMGYIQQPWTFHLQRNSAQLIRNTTSEVGQFISNAALPGLILITEVLSAAGIGGLLLFVEPLGAMIVAGALTVAAWGFQRLTGNFVFRWGKARQYHDGQRILHLQQGLGSAKDVKLLGRERYFFEQFRIHSQGGAQAVQRQHFFRQLPRLWLEVLAVTGLAGLALVMIAQGKPADALLPTLGLFAAASFRLLPSINRMLTSWQSLRYCKPVIDSLHRELELVEPAAVRASGQPLPLRRDLVLEEVSYQYPGASRRAVDRVSLTIKRGAVVGFIGGSGAGKTTLVDLILGLLVPTCGFIKVDGVDIHTNLRGWQDQIGYVPQSIYLTDDSLRRNVAFGLAEDEIDDALVLKAIRAAQLEEFVNSLPDGVETVVGERGMRLSGGQRQRIGIARALYHEPPILVLDEATSALDVDTERSVVEAVDILGGELTVLIIAHRISTLGNCDMVVNLDHGRMTLNGSYRSVVGKL